MSDIHALPLSPREAELLQLLERKANGNYPLSFSLEWLVDTFYENNSNLIAPSNALTSIRSTMASLGLKLMAIGAGHIRRLTRRGAGQKGQYEFNKNQESRLVLSKGRAVVMMGKETV